VARLLFISLMPSQYTGASEEVFIRTAKEALQRGHRVLFSVPYEGEIHPYLNDLEMYGARIQLRKNTENNNVFVKVIHKVRRLKAAAGNLPQGWFDTFNEIHEFQPDLIYVNEGMVFQLMNYKDVWFILNKINIPAFVFNHGHDEIKVYPYAVVEWLRESYIDRFRKIYFISKNNLLAAERQVARKIPQAQVVKNMCRVYPINPLPFPSLPLRMAMIARFDAQIKGHHLLIEALAHEELQQKDWHLDIFGYGPDEALIREWIKYFNLQDKIHLMGKAENLIELWREHHVFLLPSLLEGLPQTVLEAAILGRPSLVTPVGEAPLLVRDGITGFVAEGIGVSAIKNALMRLFSSPHEELALMGQRAAEHIKKFIDPAPWETMLDDILATAGLPLYGNRC